MQKSANISKKKDLIAWFIYFFLFCSFAIFSYFAGYNLDSIQRFSRFMFLDQIEENNASSYLHGELLILDGKEFSYQDAQALQSRSRIKYPSYFTVGQNGRLPFYSNAFELETTSFSVGSLFTFSDSTIMECIPLLLYKDLGFVMRSDSAGNLPCYISNVMAHEIIEKNESYNTLEDFFTKPYVFDAFYDGGEPEISFVVKNIYIANNEYGDIAANVYENYCQQYLNYSEHFYNWNKSFVFTYAPSLFGKFGALFNFDVKNNFGSIRNYYSDVLGYDFFNQGYDPNIFITEANGEFLNVTAQVGINRYCNSVGVFTGLGVIYVISFLIISFVFFSFGLLRRFEFYSSRHWIFISVFFCFAPLALIRISSIISGLFVDELVNNLVFNIFGNGACLAISLLFFISIIIRGLRVKKDEKTITFR